MAKNNEDSEKDNPKKRGPQEGLKITIKTPPIHTLQDLLFVIAKDLVHRPPIDTKAEPITKIFINANMNGNNNDE